MRNGRADGDYPGMPKIHDFDIGRGETDDGAGPAGDQSEREINKIQIDNEERLSFLIPHSSPGLAPSLSTFFSFRGSEYVQIGHLKSVEAKA